MRTASLGVQPPKAVRRHAVRRADADGEIRLHCIPEASQQLPQRNPQMLSIQVIQCHVQCRLGTGVVHHGGVDTVEQRLPLLDIPANKPGPDDALHRPGNGGQGIPGDDGGGRGLAPPDVLGVGVHLHNDALHALHRPQGGAERRFQRHSQLEQPDVRNSHGRAASSGQT